MDELAARVKADPVEYRLRHLRDARLKEVLSGRGEDGELGDAAVAQTRESQNRYRHGTRRGVACSTKATTATRRWSPRSK